MNSQSGAMHHCISSFDGLIVPENSCGSVSCGIEDTVAEVERRLKDKRRIGGRPESIDEMSPEELAAEKLAMQKALLLLEKICGRATSKQDREIVRPLYDRYRTLKRIVARAASVSTFCFIDKFHLTILKISTKKMSIFFSQS